MARGSNIVTHHLRGNLGDLTFVDSRRYGPHVRSRRGSIKPARLNEAMAKSARRMAQANIPAKTIFDAVRGWHKDGELWNKLVVLFRKQLREGRACSVDALAGLECHEVFTLDQLISATSCQFGHRQEGDRLLVDWSAATHLDWSHLEKKYDFAYRLSLIALFPDLKKGVYHREVVHGPVTGFKTPPQPIRFEVPVPDDATDYVLFLLASVYEGDEVPAQSRIKGMGVMGTGKAWEG